MAKKKRKTQRDCQKRGKRRGCNIGLRDIGPQMRLYQAIRDGIRGIRKANDRGACKDAGALIRLTEQAMRDVPVLKAEREYFNDEKARYNRGCRR
jgi:hypothetical protein